MLQRLSFCVDGGILTIGEDQGHYLWWQHLAMCSGCFRSKRPSLSHVQVLEKKAAQEIPHRLIYGSVVRVAYSAFVTTTLNAVAISGWILTGTVYSPVCLIGSAREIFLRSISTP